jgi:hypothetical protein
MNGAAGTSRKCVTQLRMSSMSKAAQRFHLSLMEAETESDWNDKKNQKKKSNERKQKGLGPKTQRTLVVHLKVSSSEHGQKMVSFGSFPLILSIRSMSVIAFKINSIFAFFLIEREEGVGQGCGLMMDLLLMAGEKWQLFRRLASNWFN